MYIDKSGGGDLLQEKDEDGNKIYFFQSLPSPRSHHHVKSRRLTYVFYPYQTKGDFSVRVSTNKEPIDPISKLLYSVGNWIHHSPFVSATCNTHTHFYTQYNQSSFIFFNIKYIFILISTYYNCSDIKTKCREES
jgi:hypothetical protein